MVLFNEGHLLVHLLCTMMTLGTGTPGIHNGLIGFSGDALRLFAE
jgi:hypothetical protein